jgi:hypothetical protein
MKTTLLSHHQSELRRAQEGLKAWQDPMEFDPDPMQSASMVVIFKERIEFHRKAVEWIEQAPEGAVVP